MSDKCTIHERCCVCGEQLFIASMHDSGPWGGPPTRVWWTDQHGREHDGEPPPGIEWVNIARAARGGEAVLTGDCDD